MRHLTIRNLPAEVAEALEEERDRSRASLNQTVIDLLSRALCVGSRRAKRNGLASLAGTWTEEEHERFQAAVAVTEQIDEELWR
jgi:plasmid stability protein